MTIQTRKFARKPYYVDEIQVTEENMEAVAEWCGGDIRRLHGKKYINVQVERPLNKRQTRAFVGDHILFAGGYKVYPDRAFEKSFEPVDSNPASDLPISDQQAAYAMTRMSLPFDPDTADLDPRQL